MRRRYVRLKRGELHLSHADLLQRLRGQRKLMDGSGAEHSLRERGLTRRGHVLRSDENVRIHEDGIYSAIMKTPTGSVGVFICGLFHEVAETGRVRADIVATAVFVTAPSAGVVFVYVMAKATAIEHRVVRRIVVVEPPGIGDSEDSSRCNSRRRPSETFRSGSVQAVGRGRSTNFFIRSRCRKGELFAAPDELVRTVENHGVVRRIRENRFLRVRQRI